MIEHEIGEIIESPDGDAAKRGTITDAVPIGFVQALDRRVETVESVERYGGLLVATEPSIGRLDVVRSLDEINLRTRVRS